MTKIMLAISGQPAPRKVERRGPAHVLGQEGAATGSSSPIGSTFWKRVRRCPREHALYNLARLRGFGDDEALTVGFLVHHGLEVFYRVIWEHQRRLEASGYDTRNPDHYFLHGATQHAQQQAWAALECVAREPGYHEPTGDGRVEPTWTVVERCLAAYFERWGDRDRWRIIAVEETIEYRGSDGGAGPLIDYSARLDLMVECYDRGGFWCVEHKTARSITRDLLEGYQLDLQTLGQSWLVTRCLDLSQLPPFRGVLVNIVSKQKTPVLERVEVCASEQHLAAFERATWAWKHLVDVMGKLGFPHAFGACTGPDRGYRRCDYFDLCHAYPMASIEAFAAGPAPEGYVQLPQGVIDVDYEVVE